MKMLVVLLLVLSKMTTMTMTMIAMMMKVVTINVICGHHNKEVKGNNTARLKMRMLVVLLMVLSKMTTRTTKRFPMNPMMITRVKITGT